MKLLTKYGMRRSESLETLHKSSSKRNCCRQQWKRGWYLQIVTNRLGIQENIGESTQIVNLNCPEHLVRVGMNVTLEIISIL